MTDKGVAHISIEDLYQCKNRKRRFNDAWRRFVRVSHLESVIRLLILMCCAWSEPRSISKQRLPDFRISKRNLATGHDKANRYDEFSRRGGRVVDCTGLENRQRMQVAREFESPPLRFRIRLGFRNFFGISRRFRLLSLVHFHRLPKAHRDARKCADCAACAGKPDGKTFSAGSPSVSVPVARSACWIGTVAGERRRELRQRVERLRFIGQQRVAVPHHRQVDVAVPGQTLRQLRMHVAGGQHRDERVPQGVEVGEQPSIIDVGDASRPPDRP